MSATDEDHFLSHPEVEKTFDEVFSTLVSESDRGAVLVGASIVDAHLGELFRRVAPAGMSRKHLKELLDYSGALGTFSGKLNVAYAVRLISQNLHRSIHLLRRIRNDVAHSPSSFRLKDHDDRLRQMYDLGPGIPIAINRLAGELLLRSVVEDIMDRGPELQEEMGRNPFESPQDVLKELQARPKVMNHLEGRLPRFELAMAIVLICGLLVAEREAALRVLGGHKLVGACGSSASERSEEPAFSSEPTP